MSKILIVEDDIAFCNMLQTFLSKKGFEVSVVYCADAALEKMKNITFDVILTDIRLPEKEGTVILKEVILKKLPSKVILMTGYAEINKAVEAMKIGAFDYISKPVSPERLLETIKSALIKEADGSNENLVEDNKPKATTLTKKAPSKSYIQGISDSSKKLNDYIKLVAPTTMSVLIIGDSGTGKEYIAKTIHNSSKRNTGPFVPVDCGAVPKEIASSEFFGHVKGSFTGAISN
ncbi:MAG: sigma-54-dependent Fis family transcriptional regulator, partial [Flavobacteriales bacterium]|nr:sigma-54-dependent Fis family transcriptional regulator [Flavobacteriales bacterium]